MPCPVVWAEAPVVAPAMERSSNATARAGGGGRWMSWRIYSQMLAWCAMHGCGDFAICREPRAGRSGEPNYIDMKLEL